jgi:hypothetical protein
MSICRPTYKTLQTPIHAAQLQNSLTSYILYLTSYILYLTSYILYLTSVDLKSWFFPAKTAENAFVDMRQS